MASTNSPFADPELDKTLPQIPPSLSITRASGKMEAQPVIAPQTSNKASPRNPFADPSGETHSNSTSPATPHPLISRSPALGSAIRANTAQNGTAVRDFTSATIGDSLTADPKPSSSKSAASTAASSSRTGSTTLISSTHGGAKTTAANSNPFTDPRSQARVQDRGHAGNGTGPSTPLPRSMGTPIYNQYYTPSVPNNYLRPTPTPNSSIPPTPPPKSPLRALGLLGSNRWTSVSAITNRISLGTHAQGNASVNSLAREALARESARRQDQLLAAERAKSGSSQPNLNEPHLRPSPSAVRLAADLIRARDEKAVYGSHAVLTSGPFWIAILFVQCGLVSTSASIAVIIESSQNGTKIYVGTGRAFWLAISIMVFVAAAGVAFMIWMRKRGVGFGSSEEGILRRLGCDEVGLLDRAVVRDVEMGRMESGERDSENADRGRASSPRESLRHRHRGQMPTSESIGSIRTRDPEWQAMYATPKELKKMVSWETIGDTPVRRGAYGLHKDTNRSRRYDEQRSKPPQRKPKSKPEFQHFAEPARQPKPENQNFNDPTGRYEDQRANAPQRKAGSKPGNQTLTRSDKSWPLRNSPNAQPFVNIHPEYPSPYQIDSPASDQTLLQQYSSDSYSRNYATSQHQKNPPPLPTSSKPINTEPRNRTGTGTGTESRVEVLSPLSSLTQIIQNASQSSLPPHHHPQYIHGHRVASEERVRSLRQSLESHSRGNSASRDLSRVQSNTPSAVTERFQEYVADIEGKSEEEERVGRPRSRSVRVVLESYFDAEDAVEKNGEEVHHHKAGEVLANGKGHFHVKEQPRGRSLGEVVREKMTKLKEAGVESDPAPALSTSPQREREIFIVGDDTPIKTPIKTSRNSTTNSPGQTPTKSTNNSPNKGLASSPLSRKD